MKRKRETSADINLWIAQARCMEEDAVQWLLEAVFYACYDWIVDGREPALDEDRNRRVVKERMAGLVEGIRAEIARLGLTATELGSRLGWPEDRVELVLAEPSKLGFVEAQVLCRVLGTSEVKMLEAGEGMQP